MTHTEIIVVDSGYFDPNDGFAARPIIGSQAIPESGYEEGVPFYQVVPSSEWWGDEYEWNWGHAPNTGVNARTTGSIGYLTLTGGDGCGDPAVCGDFFLGSVVQIKGRKSSNIFSPLYDEFETVTVSITGQENPEGVNGTRLYFTGLGRAIGPTDDGISTGRNSWYMDMFKWILGDKKENNTDVETKGYNVAFGINYYFPLATGDLNEDFQASTRFGDVRWYEQSGLIPTYPSNHPDESRDPQRAQNPKERVYGHQGSRDAAGAANNLEAGNPKSSIDSSTDGSFSNASDSTNTNYVLGIQNAFLHYYEDDYGFVYKPGGRTGPTRTLVNEYEALNFNDRHKHGGNRPGRISDKADKIFGSPFVADAKYKHSAYVTRETPDADEETTEGLSASGYTPFGGRIGEN